MRILNRSKQTIRSSMAIFFFILFPLIPLQTASAITIGYEAIDLIDTGTGDLWQYNYTIDGYAFNEWDELNIYFDYNSYGGLTPQDSTPGWDIYALQPDPGLPDDGVFATLALEDTPALDAFSVSFLWFGGDGTPGAQMFDIYDENFQVITQGVTTPKTLEPVPEPATMTLCGLGLLLAAAFIKKQYALEVSS